MRIAIALLVLLNVNVSPAWSAQEGEIRLDSAVATQAQTRARLGVLGDAFSCPEARFVSFRRSDAEPELSDQWYVASQLWADAALLETATRLKPPDVVRGTTGR